MNVESKLTNDEKIVLALFCVDKAVRFARIAPLAERLHGAARDVVNSLEAKGLIARTPRKRHGFHITEAGLKLCPPNSN